MEIIVHAQLQAHLFPLNFLTNLFLVRNSERHYFHLRIIAVNTLSSSVENETIRDRHLTKIFVDFILLSSAEYEYIRYCQFACNSDNEYICTIFPRL